MLRVLEEVLNDLAASQLPCQSLLIPSETVLICSLRSIRSAAYKVLVAQNIRHYNYKPFLQWHTP